MDVGTQLAPFLTDAQLRHLAGGSAELDLATVESIELTADASEHSLAALGARLPALAELKLSGSRVPSLRELGTRLSGLTVLWIARSGLETLDGIAALPRLRELYASFNRVQSLEPCVGLAALEVVDLEGNEVAAAQEAAHLRDATALHALVLTANPCTRGGERAYRREVRRALPWLALLDELPLADGEAATEADVDDADDVADAGGGAGGGEAGAGVRDEAARAPSAPSGVGAAAARGAAPGQAAQAGPGRAVEEEEDLVAALLRQGDADEMRAYDVSTLPPLGLGGPALAAAAAAGTPLGLGGRAAGALEMERSLARSDVSARGAASALRPLSGGAAVGGVSASARGALASPRRPHTSAGMRRLLHAAASTHGASGPHSAHPLAATAAAVLALTDAAGASDSSSASELTRGAEPLCGALGAARACRLRRAARAEAGAEAEAEAVAETDWSRAGRLAPGFPPPAPAARRPATAGGGGWSRAGRAPEAEAAQSEFSELVTELRAHKLARALGLGTWEAAGDEDERSGAGALAEGGAADAFSRRLLALELSQTTRPPTGASASSDDRASCTSDASTHVAGGATFALGAGTAGSVDGALLSARLLPSSLPLAMGGAVAHTGGGGQPDPAAAAVEVDPAADEQPTVEDGLAEQRQQRILLIDSGQWQQG